MSKHVGGPSGTLGLLMLLAVWAVVGVLLGWEQTHQVVVEFACVASFVLLFLLQRSQNKAMLSLQLKLNELLASAHQASPDLINVENRSEREVKEIHDRFQEIQQRGPGAHSIADTLEAEAVAGPGRTT